MYSYASPKITFEEVRLNSKKVTSIVGNEFLRIDVLDVSLYVVHNLFLQDSYN